MPTVIRRCPAKINLSLRVLGRRADGFHELDSVFLPLAQADELVLSVVPQRTTVVSCRCLGQPELDGASNLAARAAHAYLLAAGQTARVTIHLRKRIWQAAGLGGGSSDAAAVLLELGTRNAELGTRTGVALSALARQLGADVPFFLDPRPCRATGVGHLLTPLEGVPSLELVLVNPGRPLSTARVFAELGLQPGESFRRHGEHEPVPVPDTGDLTALLGNDLQPAAQQLEPEIARMQQALLDHGARAACMTGSGPTVFGIFGGAEEAGEAARRIRRDAGYLTVATRTVGSEVDCRNS